MEKAKLDILKAVLFTLTKKVEFSGMNFDEVMSVQRLVKSLVDWVKEVEGPAITPTKPKMSIKPMKKAKK